MPTLEQKAKRAAQARINGAKSRGPITPEGQERARTASLQHGLYATEETLKLTIDPAKFEELRADYAQIWAPENRYLADKVNDLAAARWQLDRLNLIRRQQITELFEQTNSVSEAELAASAKGHLMERLEARIRRASIEISRLERDLLRLKKHFQSEGASHNPLKTKEEAAPATPSAPATRASAPPSDSPEAPDTPRKARPTTPSFPLSPHAPDTANPIQSPH